MKVLSLDGGASRGKMQTTILEGIEQGSGKRISESFDLMVGSSVGSLIIALSVYSNMSMREINDIFNSKTLQQIFSKSVHNYIPFITSKYDGIGKRQLINKYLPNVPMNSTDKKIIITGYNVNEMRPIFFKSWECEYSIRDVVDACTSAPTYFHPVSITDELLVGDAAVYMNNPSMKAYTEALQLFSHPINVLSLGTGRLMFKKPTNKTYGMLQWVTSDDILDGMLQVPEGMIDEHLEIITSHFGDKYIRINPELEVFKFDTSDQEYLDYLDYKAKEIIPKYEKELKIFF